jgi:hypothetical protein
MLAPRTRYYAFVSRFVDAVVTEPLSQELSRLRTNRLQNVPPAIPWVAPTVLDTRKAA